MSAKLSQEITDCVRAGRYVLSAFEIEGPRVAALFLDITRPHHEDDDAEPRPDAFLVAVERKLRASLDHLIESDFAVARATGLESELRQRHRNDKRRLALQIVALRRMVLAQYLEPDMENLGLQPVNVRDAITILRRAELVGERFEAINLAQMLGTPRFEGAVNLHPHVAEIRVKSAELLSLLREIDEAHRAADRARINRNRAREVYDRAFLRGARMFEDLCRFAGLDDLADRVRKPERRAKVSKEDRRDDKIEQQEAEAEPLAEGEAVEPLGVIDQEGAVDRGVVSHEGADIRAVDERGSTITGDAEPIAPESTRPDLFTNDEFSQTMKLRGSRSGPSQEKCHSTRMGFDRADKR